MTGSNMLEIIGSRIFMTFLFVFSLSAIAAANTSKAPGYHKDDENQGDSEDCSPCQKAEEIGCKCEHYEYMLKGSVCHFYNVEQCLGISQVPNVTDECNSHLLLRASFSNNPLRTIPPFSFKGFRVLNDEHFLSELQLSNTSLTSIDPNAFYGMRGFFRAVDLSHNLLTTLPEAITTLEGLEKLLLNDNSLVMKSFEELHGRNSSSEHFAEIQVIDLSNNQLIGIPEVVPTSGSNNLQEISLHGNPITQDLSAFVPLLSKYPKLQKITWPLKTMTCSCVSMAILAKNLYSDFNFRAIYISGKSRHFSNWKPVTCDRYSETAFIGRSVGLLSDREVARICLEKVRPYLFEDATIEKPIISSAVNTNGSPAHWSKQSLMNILPLLVVLSLLV